MATNGLDILGEMGDRAVAQPALDRRPVGLGRPLHHDEGASIGGQALIGAARRVAGDPSALRRLVALVVEKTVQRGQMRDPRRRGAVPDDAGDAALEGIVRVERERDLDPIGRQRLAGAVGPFHHHHGAGNVVDAELGELAQSGQTVEVGMHEGELRQVIGLHQGEGRARHLDLRTAGEMGDHGAHQRGLAGAEAAGQRDEVAGRQQVREVDGETPRRVLVGERDCEGRRPG